MEKTPVFDQARVKYVTIDGFLLPMPCPPPNFTKNPVRNSGPVNVPFLAYMLNNPF